MKIFAACPLSFVSFISWLISVFFGSSNATASIVVPDNADAAAAAGIFAGGASSTIAAFCVGARGGEILEAVALIDSDDARRGEEETEEASVKRQV